MIIMRMPADSMMRSKLFFSFLLSKQINLRAANIYVCTYVCVGMDREGERENEEDEDILGWPPINSLRKELLIHQQQQGRRRAVGVGVMMRNRNYKYVKVKMEGVPIGRKIDLTLYHSYQSLMTSLINMFSKCKLLTNNLPSNSFSIT